MSLSSVRSETALRSRLFSSSTSFRRFTCSVFSPSNSWRHREYVTSLTPIWRMASAMGCPCETRTSTCRNFATISSGLYRFLAIAVLLDVKDIPQVGPLQWGWIIIEHMIDPVGFVTGAFDLLSDRGYLYIECPNNLALFLKLKNRLRRKFGRMNFYNSLEIGEHLWGFSQRSMTMFMRVCGYDVVFCKDYPM